MSAVLRLAVLLLPVVLLYACGKEEETLPSVSIGGQIMGTTFSVKVVSGPPELDADTLYSAIEPILEEVDTEMSTYRSDSELSAFNDSDSTDWYPVDPGMASVVAEALRLGLLSEGALDVTVGPLVNLWGFGPGDAGYRVPDDQELAAVRGRIGSHYLQVRQQPPALRKQRPDLHIDLSAVAKGYAVDRVAEYLRSQSVASFLVEVGGELRVQGHNSQGGPWRIAVENPVPGSRSVYQVITPGEMGVATSGDYRNYFEDEGRRYTHTIDPATGRPIAHALASVSVVHPSALTADGLATAIMVLGPERGFELATREQLAVLLIIKGRDGFESRMTPQFSAYLVGLER